MQAVSRRAEAGYTVYVILEAPLVAYGIECAGCCYRHILYSASPAVGRRFEYLEAEASVGEVVSGELGGGRGSK